MKKFVFSTIMVLACLISFDLLAECTGISFDPAMDFGEAYDENGNVTGYYPNTIQSYDLSGFTSEDQAGIFSIEFYPNDLQNGDWTTEAAAVGTYDLGAGNNTNYATCNQCVRMYHFVQNPEATTEAEAWTSDKQFFQQEGTLQITHTDFVENDHYYYNGVVSVKLAEATVNSSTWASSFVEGGDCYEIESGAWTTYPEGSDPSDTGSDPVDTGDTEVPGDTGDTEAPADDTPADTETPADDTPADTDGETTGTGNEENNSDQTPAAEDDEDSSGCALVTI
ncbi:hypothetical protein J6Z19_03795 [bacterium]|nr:hypothetical protein [bacterium]